MTNVMLAASVILLGASAILAARYWVLRWTEKSRLDAYVAYKQERQTDAIENLRRNVTASAEQTRLRGGEKQ